MWPFLLGGTALGLLNNSVKQNQYEDQVHQNAAITRYSPWTGMHPTSIPQAPNLIGDVGNAALTGAAFGQGLKQDGGGADSSPVPSSPQRGQYMLTNNSWDLGGGKIAPEFQAYGNPGQGSLSAWQQPSYMAPGASSLKNKYALLGSQGY